MEKRFKVVANSTIMDAEINVQYEDEAFEMYNDFKDSGSYHQVYIMDNETGELYAHFDKCLDGNGIKITEWVAVL